MILTVTLNPAIDVTYYLDRLVRQAGLRVDRVLEQAGGKGVNVARVAAACGADVCATGLAGGYRGERLRAGLGVRDEFCRVEGETRQTVNIVETGRQGLPTELREPGPVVTGAEWDRFVGRFSALAAEADVVTMSGSLPPGVPVDAYAVLTSVTRSVSAARVIVDTGGEALRLACAAGPDLAKPNEAELATVARSQPGDVLTGADSLRDLGATAVVVSLGRSGSVAVTPDGRWRVSHDAVPGANPVGAGDALVAGLALYPSGDWPTALRRASGLAMASVLASSAGEIDPAAAGQFAANIRIRKIRGA